jgi:transcriptional regulator
MWIPDYYKIEDKQIITDFIKSVSLGTLVSQDIDYPMATHTPMEIEETENGTQMLRGHIAKVNPHSQLFKGESKVLAIFHSPASHYISSSWYEKPNAPTWNYMSVHVYGKLKILDETETWDAVARLTGRHEQISERPISLETLPKSVQRMLKGVTGFEIEIEKVEAAFKLSQNRNDKDYKNIIAELKKVGSTGANLMVRALEERLGREGE